MVRKMDKMESQRLKNMSMCPAKISRSKLKHHSFQANEFQLSGPIPAELYHRFVEFKAFVKGMFSSTGFRGKVLNSALHHQHRRVYNYSTTTKYGTVKARSDEASLKFLELVHYDEGGRIFTYVLTLDALMRYFSCFLSLRESPLHLFSHPSSSFLLLNRLTPYF